MHPLTARTALLVSAMLVAAGCGSAAAPAPHAGPGLRLDLPPRGRPGHPLDAGRHDRL